MFQYRQVLARLRQGDTEREIVWRDNPGETRATNKMRGSVAAGA